MLLVTVMVNVTVVPASAEPGVYSGLARVASLNVPVPEVVHKIVPLAALAPLTVAVTFAQIVCEPPAVAEGNGVIVNTIESVAEVHVPAGSSVVNVSVTEPAVISAAEGVYIAVAEFALLNEPDPEVVQVKLVALPPIEPARVYVPVLHIDASLPAFAVAVGLKDNIIESLTEPQGPFGSLVVNVRVTEPALISFADGVYTAVADVVLLNVPDPEVVQVKLVAPPEIAPDNV